MRSSTARIGGCRRDAAGCTRLWSRFSERPAQRSRRPDTRRGGQLTSVACSRKTLGVDLVRCFSNSRKPLRALIRRVLRGAKRSGSRPPRQGIEDARGPVARKSPVVQTRLNAQSRAELLDGYREGAPARELAERFRVHRGTVWALARRAGLPPRNGAELPQQV